jgi:hypothetical protein
LICSKCQTTIHKEHYEETVIIDVPLYLEQALNQFSIFKEKFQKFIEISSSNFPIDDRIFSYIHKQKKIIDSLNEDHKNFIEIQFENFHKKIDQLKQLELNNLNNFQNFFSGKFIDLENKINELIEEKEEGKKLIKA